MKKLIVIMALLMASAIFAAHASAVSLWTETSDSLYSDQKALYVGDIITIVVNESTSATQNAKTEVSQKEAMKSGTGDGIIGKFLEKFGIEATDVYKADGKTQAGGSLRTTITAEVVEVLPNGNLVIEARRSLIVNEETQTMILSGVVRGTDVVRDNKISSQRIANLSVRYQGKGQISKRQKPGVLNKIFNMIF